MELLAIIEALKKLKTSNVEVHITSDSRYVVDAIKKGWLFQWEKKNFKGRKNPDLWKGLLPLYRKYKPKFHWVRGHNDHPQNERCDALAVEASHAVGLPADEGYEGQKEM